MRGIDAPPPAYGQGVRSARELLAAARAYGTASGDDGGRRPAQPQPQRSVSFQTPSIRDSVSEDEPFDVYMDSTYSTNVTGSTEYNEDRTHENEADDDDAEDAEEYAEEEDHHYRRAGDTAAPPPPSDDYWHGTVAPFNAASPTARVHAWETDGDFPIKEIERIRKKTRRLRSQRGQEEDDDHVDDPDGDEDDGFRVYLPPDAFGPVRRQHERVTTYSQPWANDLASLPSRGQDSLDDILDRAGHSLMSSKEMSQCYAIPEESGKHPSGDASSRGDDEDPTSEHQQLSPEEELNYLARDPSLEQINTGDSSGPQQFWLADSGSFGAADEEAQYNPFAAARDVPGSADDDGHNNPFATATARKTSTSADDDAHNNPFANAREARQQVDVDTHNNPFAAVQNAPSSRSEADQHRPPAQQELQQQQQQQHPYANHDDAATVETPATSNTEALQLHDLCGEAASLDDVAWRDALFLLSSRPDMAKQTDANHRWTPLHICCMGPHPAPSFMVHALLFAHAAAARWADAGGRLPLHLAAASAADVATMRALLEEYPPALVARDDQGFTPLHLLLRNTGVELTVERVRVLLGLPDWTTPSRPSPADPRQSRNQHHILQRRGEHLSLRPEEVVQWQHRPKPVTRFHQPMVVDHEALFDTYPIEVQLALKKLSKWKRTLQKNSALDTSRNANTMSEASLPLDDAEGNPAAIPSPNRNQLPVHVVLRRAFIHQTVLSDPSRTINQKTEGDHEQEDDDDDDDKDLSSLPRTSQPSVPYPFDVLRLVVAAYPDALVHRDSEGFTPLLLTLTDPEFVPEPEVVELLLGTRTANAYENLPEWSEDLMLHQHPDSRYINPAMVPAAQSGQLPLHLAAEEFIANFQLLKSIRDCYPGAIHVQDNLGRTPLHMALRSFQRVTIEPRVLAALYSERVARISDTHGQLPIDLLLDGFQSLPVKAPAEWDDDENQAASVIYRDFIVTSLDTFKRPSNLSKVDELLQKLRCLPSWLRQQACSSSFVQDLIIQDLSTPWKCAFMILDGLILTALIAVFRLQMGEYIQALNTGVLLATWYTYAVYLAATVRLVLNFSFWVVLAKFGEFQHLCLFNLPTWIDTCAMFLSIVTSVMLYGPDSEEKLLSLGTATTGMLWLTFLSYMATWFHGMAVFTGAIRKIALFLLWPLIIVVSLVIAFSQMFYTLLYLDCKQAIGVTPICSVRDAYRVVYLLARGESLASLTSYEPISNDAIVLIALFLLFLVLFCIGMLVTLFIVSAHLDFDELSITYYWEPKLAAHFSGSDFGLPEEMFSEKSKLGKFSLAHGSIWNLLMISLFGNDSSKQKHWHCAGKKTLKPLSGPYLVLAVLAIPVWLVLGLVSLGLLWPPQIREAIFRPSKIGRRARNSSDLAVSELSMMRQEISHLKAMSFHRSGETDRAVHSIADMLHSLMKEE